MECPNCGKAVPTGSSFCSKCGVALAGTDGVQGAALNETSDTPSPNRSFNKEEPTARSGSNLDGLWRSPPKGHGGTLPEPVSGNKELPGGSGKRSRAIQFVLWTVGLLTVFGGLAYAHHISNQNLQRSMGINPEVEEEGKAFIAGTLRDPSSAQFRNVKSYDTCITGQVNGKNGFGGYAGYNDFFYDGLKKNGQIKPADVVQDGSLAALKSVVTGANYSAAESECLMSSSNK